MRSAKILLIALAVLVTGVYAALQVQSKFFTDRTPPVLSFDADTLQVSVFDSEDALLQGVYAQDDKDGDLTAQVRVRSVSQLLEDHTAQVSYIVFDSADNMAVATRTLRYTDYQPPRFALDAPLVYSPGATIALRGRLTASDLLDGDLSYALRLTSFSVNTAVEGTYHLTVAVTNSMGDTAQLSLPVTVRASSRLDPVITLNTGLVYLPVGAGFDPAAYFETVQEDAAADPVASMEGVQISGEVDTSQPGRYEVTYYYANEDADQDTHEGETSAILTVVVQ